MFPAIDAGTPVSRIGGKAQHPAIARECRRLRLDYPQFLELELFTRFCTRLDENMTSRVQRGKLLRALLRQGRLAPRSPTYQMAWLVALKQGWLDGQDERAELLGELRDIVQAMKNVAFAELQRLNRDLPALAEARDAVHQALASLPGADEPDAAAAPRRQAPSTVWLMIGAERGFCGGFNAHLALELAQIGRAEPRAEVLVASRRLLHLISPEATSALALPGCSAVDDSADAPRSPTSSRPSSARCPRGLFAAPRPGHDRRCFRQIRTGARRSLALRAP